MVSETKVNQVLKNSLSPLNLINIKDRLLLIPNIPNILSNWTDSMSKPKCFIPKAILIVLRVIHLSNDFSPLVELAKEFFIIFKAVEVINDLLKLILLQTVPVVQTLVMHIQHLTRVLRFVEIEVIKSFHGFDDAWQVN